MEAASVPAATETDVQPDVQPADAGQGDAGQGGEGSGLYDLSGVPEELRPYVEEQAKKIEANATRKFTEHSEERKRWEPLTSIEGIGDIPGEEMAELVEFHGVASDPEKFEEWWNNAGEKLGLFADDEGEGGQGEGEPEGDGEEPELVGELRAEIAELKEALGPLQAHQASSEQQQRQDKIKDQLGTELEQIHTEHHGDASPEEWEQIRGAVVQLAHAYPDPEDGAISKAYQDYLGIVGKAQGELVDSKLAQPRPSLNGGKPDSEPETLKLGDPRLKAAARARVAAGG